MSVLFHTSILFYITDVCVCACVCVRARVRARVCVCVCVCVRARANAATPPPLFLCFCLLDYMPHSHFCMYSGLWPPALLRLSLMRLRFMVNLALSSSSSFLLFVFCCWLIVARTLMQNLSYKSMQINCVKVTEAASRTESMNELVGVCCKRQVHATWINALTTMRPLVDSSNNSKQTKRKRNNKQTKTKWNKTNKDKTKQRTKASK